MPNRITEVIKNANVRGVASDGLGTIDLSVGETYYNTYLYVKTAAGAAVAVADIKSEIEKIRLRADGKLLIDATPTFLLDLYLYYNEAYGATNRAGIIPINFQRRALPDALARALFAMGTADIGNLAIEVEFGTLTNVASIEVYREVSSEKRAMVDQVRILPYPENFGTTGKQTVTSLPKRVPFGVLAQHIEESTGTIDDVTIVANKNDIFQEIPVNVNDTRLDLARRSPQSGYYHVAYDLEDHRSGFLYLGNLQEYRAEITWSSAAPDNYTIYQEEIHNLTPGMLENARAA